MGWTSTGLLLALWVLGLASGAALGGWLHLLLLYALVSLIVSVVRTGSARVG